jgi:hypothetical protein
MNRDKPFCHEKNSIVVPFVNPTAGKKHCKKFGMDTGSEVLDYLNLMLVGSLRILESNRSKISQASVRVGGYISIENN